MGLKEKILEPYDEKKGGILLSILLILVVIPALGYGRGWAFAGALRWLDTKILSLTLGESYVQSHAMWNLLRAKAIVAWFLVFFVLGSFTAAKLSKEFGIKFDRAALPESIIGGLLMGIGIVFITTCNIGIFLNSLPMLNIGAYLAGIGLVIGTYIGAKIYAKRMGL